MRRNWAASEAQACGRGGPSAVSEVIGMSPNTIRKGLGGLEALKGIEPVHTIAAKYQIRPVQMSQWKKKEAAKRRDKKLFEETGRLKRELESLKKRASSSTPGGGATKIHLATEPIDLRRGYSGLCTLGEQQFGDERAGLVAARTDCRCGRRGDSGLRIGDRSVSCRGLAGYLRRIIMWS